MKEACVGKDTLLFAQALGAAATAVSNIDTKGSRHVTIRLALSQEINTNAVGPTISLKESDDTVVTNFATVLADRTDEDCTAKREVRWEIDTRGRKRYLRLSVSSCTHTTNDLVSACAAIATLSENEADPVDTAASSGASVLVNKL